MSEMSNDEPAEGKDGVEEAVAEAAALVRDGGVEEAELVDAMERALARRVQPRLVPARDELVDVVGPAFGFGWCGREASADAAGRLRDVVRSYARLAEARRCAPIQAVLPMGLACLACEAALALVPDAPHAQVLGLASGALSVATVAACANNAMRAERGAGAAAWARSWARCFWRRWAADEFATRVQALVGASRPAR